MLAHALDEPDLATLAPSDFMAEWKWDGIRVQAAAATPPPLAGEGRVGVARLYSRTGEDISRVFLISWMRCVCPAPSTANS